MGYVHITEICEHITLHPDHPRLMSFTSGVVPSPRTDPEEKEEEVTASDEHQFFVCDLIMTSYKIARMLSSCNVGCAWPTTPQVRLI